MKNVLAVLSFTLLAGCCSDAFADDFGSRFGNSSPYALQNTMGKATETLNGIGLDDLNTITPAAGSEEGGEEEGRKSNDAATAPENSENEGADTGVIDAPAAAAIPAREETPQVQPEPEPATPAYQSLPAPEETKAPQQ